MQLKKPPDQETLSPLSTYPTHPQSYPQDATDKSVEIDISITNNSLALLWL